MTELTQAQQAQILRATLEGQYYKLGIEQANKDSINCYLDLMAAHHLPTHNHEVRCALKGIELAEFTSSNDAKTMLYGNAFHDLGKLLVRIELLDKTGEWTPEDRAEMDNHTQYGFELVRDKHLFSAFIAAYSHSFKRGFKGWIPEFPENFSPGTRALILYDASLVSLVDCRDSALTRPNERNSPGNPRCLSREEALDMLIREHAHHKFLIERLAKASIF